MDRPSQPVTTTGVAWSRYELVPRSLAWLPRPSSVNPCVLPATAGPKIKAQRPLPGWVGQSGQRVREDAQQRRFVPAEAWAGTGASGSLGALLAGRSPGLLSVPVLGMPSRELLTTPQQHRARGCGESRAGRVVLRLHLLP